MIDPLKKYIAKTSLIKDLKFQIKDIEDQANKKIDEIKSKISAIEQEVSGAKSQLEAEFKKTGECEVKVNGVKATLGYRKMPVKVLCDDVESIPEEFIRIKKEPNKPKIKKHLNETKESVNWASLQADDPVFEIKFSI